MYHPTYNPNGAKRASDNLPWHSTTVVFNSTVDCFNTTKLDLTSGLIGGATGTSSQYDFADSVYAGQVQDLRLDAKKRDSVKLREDVVRKDVVGTTRGVGKVPFSTVYDDAGTGVSANAPFLWWNLADSFVIYLTLVGKDVSLGDMFYCIDNTLDFIVRGEVTEITNTGTQEYITAAAGSWTTVSGSTPTGAGTGNEVYYILEKELSPSYDSLPWVDIIGSPANIITTFSAGVVGKWVPQIPTVANAVFPLNRKTTALANIKRVFTTDNGDNWTSNNLTINPVTSETNPTYSDPAYVSLHFYEVLSNFTESDINRPIYGDKGDVVFTSGNDISYGNRLQPSLTGGIGTDDSAQSFAQTLGITNHWLSNLGAFITGAARSPIHSPAIVVAPTNSSPAVKALTHLVERDGLLYMQYHGREVLWDGSDWGDDNTIPIVDNEGVVDDANTVSVKTFTHTSKFPVGIATV